MIYVPPLATVTRSRGQCWCRAGAAVGKHVEQQALELDASKSKQGRPLCWGNGRYGKSLMPGDATRAHFPAAGLALPLAMTVQVNAMRAVMARSRRDVKPGVLAQSGHFGEGGGRNAGATPSVPQHCGLQGCRRPPRPRNTRPSNSLMANQD